MSKLKIEKGNFTTTLNDIFRYEKDGVKLSPEAWGIYVFMLSLPDNWDYTISGLTAVINAGRNKIQRVLKELEDAGFISREQVTGSDGKFGKIEYTILRSPYPQKPHTDKPYPQKPYTENEQQQSTKELRTKELKKNKHIDRIESIDNIVDIEDEKEKEKTSLSQDINLELISSLVQNHNLKNVDPLLVLNHLKLRNFTVGRDKVKIDSDGLLLYLEMWNQREWKNTNKKENKKQDWVPSWVDDYMKELEELEDN